MWLWFVSLDPEMAILLLQVLTWMAIAVAVVTAVAIVISIIHRKRNKKFRDEFLGNNDKEGK